MQGDSACQRRLAPLVTILDRAEARRRLAERLRVAAVRRWAEKSSLLPPSWHGLIGANTLEAARLLEWAASSVRGSPARGRWRSGGEGREGQGFCVTTAGMLAHVARQARAERRQRRSSNLLCSAYVHPTAMQPAGPVPWLTSLQH